MSSIPSLRYLLRTVLYCTVPIPRPPSPAIPATLVSAHPFSCPTLSLTSDRLSIRPPCAAVVRYCTGQQLRDVLYSVLPLRTGCTTVPLLPLLLFFLLFFFSLFCRAENSKGKIRKDNKRKEEKGKERRPTYLPYLSIPPGRVPCLATPSARHYCSNHPPLWLERGRFIQTMPRGERRFIRCPLPASLSP